MNLDDLLNHPEWRNVPPDEQKGLVDHWLTSHPEWKNVPPEEQTALQDHAYSKADLKGSKIYDPARAEAIEPGVMQGVQPSAIQPADLLAFGLSGFAEAAGRTALEEGTSFWAPAAIQAGLKAGAVETPLAFAASTTAQQAAEPLIQKIPATGPVGKTARIVADQLAGVAPFVLHGMASAAYQGGRNRLLAIPEVQEAGKSAAEGALTDQLEAGQKVDTGLTKVEDARKAADTKFTQQSIKLRQSSAEKVLDDAKLAELEKASGGAGPSTLPQGPGRIARTAEFTGGIKGPLKQWRSDWGLRRDNAIAPFADEKPDLTPIQTSAAGELAKWQGAGHAPYSPRVLKILNDAQELGAASKPQFPDDFAFMGGELGDIKDPVKRLAQEKVLTDAGIKPPGGGSAVLPTVKDLLAKQAEINKIAEVSKGADRTAALVVSHGINESLAGVAPTAELKALNAEYHDHRLNFPPDFEAKISDVARPVDAAPLIFNEPQRVLDLVKLGDDSTRKDLGQLYFQATRDAGRTIKPEDAEFTKVLFPGTPFANPEAFVFKDKAEGNLSAVLTSSPQVKARWDGLVADGKKQIQDDYAKGLIKTGLVDSKNYGTVGKRFAAELRAAGTPDKKLAVLNKFYAGLTPESVTSEMPSAEEAGVKAIQERGYQPTKFWNSFKRRLGIYSMMLGGGVAISGHPFPMATVGVGVGGVAALREQFAKAFQNSLRNDPAKATEIYRAMSNYAVPKNFALLATEAARATMAMNLEKAGQDASVLYGKQPVSEPEPEKTSMIPKLDRSRAIQMAKSADGTVNIPRADRIQELNKQVASKPPDVQTDLNRGRLTRADVDKVLKHSEDGSMAALLKGVNPGDAIDIAAKGSAADRALIVPMLQKQIAELMKNQKMPRAQMANLMTRFNALKQMDAQPETDVG